jgi:two-component system sensor kinase FixL
MPRSVLFYLAALGLVAGSLGLRLQFAGFFGPNVIYLQFFPAILLASWFGGRGPGVVATVASALAALRWVLPATGVGTTSMTSVFPFFLFVVTGFAIAALNGRLRAAHDEARHEAALATSRAERLDAVIRTTVDGIVVIDERGAVEAFNPGAERLFGYLAAEVIGQNVKTLMPSPFHDEHDSYLRRYLSTGKAAIIGIGREVTGRRKDGSTFQLHLSVGEMTIDGTRKFTGMLHDLSSRVQLEERLRASEARWRAVIESAVDGIIVIDAHGRIEAFNPAAERMFGYHEAEVAGKNVTVLMPSPYRDEHDSYLSRYREGGAAHIIGIGREVMGRRKDGTTFPLHLSVGETVTAGERKFTGIVHDLTERVTLETRLREHSALAKLGEMAAVLAHEIKNPLAGIRGAVQVIGSRLPAASAEAGMMKEIVNRVDALDDMMRELLVFARPPKPKLTPTDVLRLIETTADLLKEDEGARDIRIELAGEAPPVAGDGAMLKMVFHNLLINGAHAMDGRGTIRVAVSTHERACRIVFADEGPGIPHETRDKVFVPFFTTKRRGTGLGLPTAKRFIEAHDGRIGIDCPLGGGTTVTVELPLH